MVRDRMSLFRKSSVKWSMAGSAVVLSLWFGDAAVRSWFPDDGTFLRLAFTPAPGTLISRLVLVLLGVAAVLCVRGRRELAVARDEAVAERRRLRELYDYTTDAVVLLDHDLRVVIMNKSAERIAGARLADCIGWPCYRCFLGQEEQCGGCRALEVFEARQPRSSVKYETTAAGQENWLEQHWYPVFDEHGEIEGVLEVARDITDLKLMEREVQVCHQALDAARRDRDGEGAVGGD